MDHLQVQDLTTGEVAFFRFPCGQTSNSTQLSKLWTLEEEMRNLESSIAQALQGRNAQQVAVQRMEDGDGGPHNDVSAGVSGVFGARGTPWSMQKQQLHAKPAQSEASTAGATQEAPASVAPVGNNGARQVL